MSVNPPLIYVTDSPIVDISHWSTPPKPSRSPPTHHSSIEGQFQTTPQSLGNHAEVLSNIATGTRTSQEFGSQATHITPGRESISEGLEEINEHTSGAEFYGPTGTFYFLSKLRSQADLHNGTNHTSSGIQTRSPNKNPSIVNLLFSSEYSVADKTCGPSQHPSSLHTFRGSFLGPRSIAESPLKSLRHQSSTKQVKMELECVRLYFENLHCIHPILDRSVFIARCESEAWTQKGIEDRDFSKQTQIRSRFLALLNAVMAVGAITAGETSVLMWDSTMEFLESPGSQGDSTASTTYPTIRFARTLFERSKLYLDDIFESSSLETVQTLFLLVYASHVLHCWNWLLTKRGRAYSVRMPSNLTAAICTAAWHCELLWPWEFLLACTTARTRKACSGGMSDDILILIA